MATQQKAAAPKKKSDGFQGVRGAFWIIVVCAIIAFTLFFTSRAVLPLATRSTFGVLSTKVVSSCLSSSLSCSLCSQWVLSVSSL